MPDPAEPVRKRRPAGPIHPRLFSRARTTRNFLAATIVIGVVSALAMIAQAWLIAHAVVTIFTTHAIAPATSWMIAALIGVFCLRGLLSWASSTLAHRAAAQVKSDLRREVLQARLARPCDSRHTSSSLIALVTNGIEALDGYYSKYLPQVGLALVVPLLVGLAILVADWPSAVLVGITLPLIPLFMALIGWTTQKAVARRFVVADRLANHFADLVEGLPTLQAFGRARAQRAGVERTEQANRLETNRTLRLSFVSSLALELLATLSVALVAVTIGFRLVFGQMDFTTALYVLVLAPEAYLPVRMVGVHFHDSADGVAAADACFEIIDEAADQSHGTARPDLRGLPLRLDHIDFAHGDLPVLQDWSATLDPGRVVVLTGPSGAGKTTVLNLVMGFEQPQGGTIRVGEHDLAQVDPEHWRSQLAWVGQNPGMVNGTVADNVRFGASGVSDEQVDQALREAGVDWPSDKPVYDLGAGLSAGERRRVALTRAIVRVRHGGATWLVMDEPTAGLDADTEARVLDSITAMGVGALIVTHREAIIAAADQQLQVLPTVRSLA